MESESRKPVLTQSDLITLHVPDDKDNILDAQFKIRHLDVIQKMRLMKTSSLSFSKKYKIS